MPEAIVDNIDCSFNSDILFYMKSKALYYDYDSKFPEKFTIKELAKKI